MLLKGLQIVLAVLSLTALGGQPYANANHRAGEYDIKAAFLLNFTKFIEWPSKPGDTVDDRFNICVWDDDPFGAVLDQTVKGENVNGRPLVVRRLRKDPSESCKILYIEPSQKSVKEILGILGPGVLTVGEGEQFVKEGGMVGFVIENRRVRFDINLPATRNAGLNLSSRLLSVARRVDK
jgi:hypothetical protein